MFCHVVLCYVRYVIEYRFDEDNNHLSPALIAVKCSLKSISLQSNQVKRTPLDSINESII